jgi:hypothetical protein
MSETLLKLLTKRMERATYKVGAFAFGHQASRNMY